MKSLLIFCAACCFVAILKLPIGYYTWLRAVVTLSALLIVCNSIRLKNYYWAIIFTVIAILFNPVFPIYLHRKLPWMPIDIIVGLLFLLLAFWKKKMPVQEEKIMPVTHKSKSYIRDRIIVPKKDNKL